MARPAWAGSVSLGWPPPITALKLNRDTQAQPQQHIANTRPMNIHLSLAPLIALLAGVLILVMPKLLNYIVAIYLILIGLIVIFGLNAMHLR